MGRVTKMAGLNMEEASLWAGGFVESRFGYAKVGRSTLIR